ncbi:FACR218Wp [Eremothecium gossypii FDAG1]|nr:FACR218Wp [Eremothecium gossypii FDAG1]
MSEADVWQQAATAGRGAEQAHREARDADSASTSSVDSVNYLQYLEKATAKNPSVLLELDPDGNVKYVSQVWETVVGTRCAEVVGRPVSEVILGGDQDKLVFQKAVAMMCQDDRSCRVRFLTALGPERAAADGEAVVELEAQGTLIHDGEISSLPAHSMWIVKPFYEVDELDDLPPDFVKRLGFGAKLFSHYLQQIEDLEVLDEQELPTPKCELCRVCETLVPAWWLETHSEMCVCEHRIESAVQLIHDELVELKRLIEDLTGALGQPGAAAEYKGLALPQPDPSDLGPAKQAPVMLHPSLSCPNLSDDEHNPFRRASRSGKDARSLFHHVRFPFKQLSLLSDLCEDAININTSELLDADVREQDSPYGLLNMQSVTYRFSPNTKNNIDHVTAWDAQLGVDDPAINLLTQDTVELVKRKVEMVLRLDNTMRHSLKIKHEVDCQVVNLIKDKIESNKINLQADETMQDLGQAAQPLFGTSCSPSSSRIATPLPQRPQSRILTDSYMASSSVTDLKAVMNVGMPPLDYTSRSNSGSHPLSRSITPRQAITDHSSSAYQLPLTVSNSNTSGGTPVDTKPPTIGTPRASSTSQCNLPKLSTIINLTPRRGSPLSSVGMNTPFSTIQRKSTVKSIGEKSPMSSPFMVGSDLLSPEGHLPSATAPKPPLSPLLLATNQAKAPTPSIKDYDIIKPISKGAYGSVYLAYKRITGEYFAIKVLRKSDMIAKNQVTNVKSERVIMMVQSEKPYVAKLYATFQNKENLFLVMEYLSGGDLATLIKMMGNLPDKWAKQYITEVIIGVDDMHMSGIIHHDLKPDNLLIDSNGHVKLTDFGLSRIGLIQRHKKHHSRHCSIQAVTSKSRHNSLTPDEALEQNGAVTCTPSNLLEGLMVSRRGERSDSISSSHSQLDAQTLHRTGSQVSFSIMDISRSGTPPPPLPAPIASLQNQLSQQPGQQQHSHMNQPQQLSLAPSSSGSMPKRSASVFSSDNSDTSRDFALFHPDEDGSRRFFGTPDYLSPETILGTGESGASDWWSVGCILFEFLLGYPPFHASTVEDVFKNILSGQIDWPSFPNKETELEYLSPEAKDLILKLLESNPDERLGANGAQEIKEHPYFKGINWSKVYDEEASFVPTVDNPEDTDYFDLRGADLDELLRDNYGEDDLQSTSGMHTPNSSMRTDKKQPSNHSSGNSTPVPKMSIASVFDPLSQDNTSSNSNSPILKHIPLAIPPHLRERRPSKLNDIQTEFGSFSYRNLSALDKANKDTINRLKSEHYSDHHHVRASPGSLSSSSSEASSKLKAANPGSSASSPICNNAGKGTFSRAGSPQMARTHSPSRRNSIEQSAAPGAGTITQRRHTWDHHITLDNDYPPPGPPITKFKSPLSPTQNMGTSRSRMQSRTSSQRTSISEISMEDDERHIALSKVNTLRSRRRSGRKSSSGTSEVGYNMDVLLCEPIPIHRYRLTRDLESLGCSVVAVGTGDEIVRRATSGVRFDLIITTLKLPKIGAVDITRLLRQTTSINCTTPIVAVTVNYHDAGTHIFDDVLERPIGTEQLRKLVSKYALFKSQQHEDTILSDSEM